MKHSRMTGGLCALALCLGLLTGCGENREAAGLATDLQLTDGQVTAFTVQAADGQKTRILLDETTHVIAPVTGMEQEDFLAGPDTDVTVLATWEPADWNRFWQDGKMVTAYRARWVEITGYRTDVTVPLSDGTRAACWQMGRDTAYRLPDGPELLRVSEPAGPGHAYASGVGSLEDLPAAAQQVEAYYARQGLLYDENAALEDAFAVYRQAGAPADFRAAELGQETLPTAASEQVLYFATSVSWVTPDAQGYEARTGAAFDKKTGARIPAEELFTVPWEEAAPALLDLAQISDPALQAEMAAALTPDCLLFYPEHLELYFSPGTLPSQTYTNIASLDYEKLRTLLQDWAVPVQKT